ncbi:hypothetical protein MRX96_013506 [Rhipicephalus microplus]
MAGTLPRQGGHSLVQLTRSEHTQMWPFHSDRRSKTPVVPAQSGQLRYGPAARKTIGAREEHIAGLCPLACLPASRLNYARDAAAARATDRYTQAEGGASKGYELSSEEKECMLCFARGGVREEEKALAEGRAA